MCILAERIDLRHLPAEPQTSHRPWGGLTERQEQILLDLLQRTEQRLAAALDTLAAGEYPLRDLAQNSLDLKHYTDKAKSDVLPASVRETALILGQAGYLFNAAANLWHAGVCPEEECFVELIRTLEHRLQFADARLRVWQAEWSQQIGGYHG